GETVLRRHQHLGRSGHAVHIGILARLVHVERMVRVLEGRDLEAAGGDRRDELGDERRFAGAAPAGQSDDAHGRVIARASPSPEGGGSPSEASRSAAAAHPKARDPPPSGEGEERAYSAGVAAGRDGAAWRLAASSSSHLLWCSFAQLTSTVPVPMASNAPSMPIVPI